MITLLLHKVSRNNGFQGTRLKFVNLRGCIQKFPDWQPGAKTATGRALCHQVQLYRYFVSQSSEFCRHNPLYCCLFLYRLSPETFGYVPLHSPQRVFKEHLHLIG